MLAGMTACSQKRSFAAVRQIAVSKLLLDHPVGALQYGLRNLESESLGSFHINHQLEPGRLLYRQICRICTFQNFIDVHRSMPEHFPKIRPVRYKPACLNEFPFVVYHW